MGVRFAREYDHIIDELSMAIGSIEDCCELIEMQPQDWIRMETEEKVTYLRTMADDLFYGLGSEPSIIFGRGGISYDAEHHIIKVFHADNVVRVIYLV